MENILRICLYGNDDDDDEDDKRYSILKFEYCFFDFSFFSWLEIIMLDGQSIVSIVSLLRFDNGGDESEYLRNDERSIGWYSLSDKSKNKKTIKCIKKCISNQYRSMLV